MGQDTQNGGISERGTAIGGPSLYLVACEDTRETLKLLSHYGIQTRLVSYHEHNEMTKASELVVDLEGGAKIALVTDAGMPGISDPGFRLIALAIRHHVPVVPIPGASAFLADVVEVLGSDRHVVVAREVTKLHEEFLRGRAAEVLEQLKARGAVKGEITLLIAKPGTQDLRSESSNVSIAQRVREIMAEEKADEKAALKKVAKERGIGKSEAYREFQRYK